MEKHLLQRHFKVPERLRDQCLLSGGGTLAVLIWSCLIECGEVSTVHKQDNLRGLSPVPFHPPFTSLKWLQKAPHWASHRLLHIKSCLLRSYCLQHTPCLELEAAGAQILFLLFYFTTVRKLSRLPWGTVELIHMQSPYAFKTERVTPSHHPGTNTT